MNDEGHAPQTLTGRQYRTVEAAASRILPTTDTPGATEAGVVVYIDRALTEAYPELAPLYREGCRALDRHARQRSARTFADLAPEAQDEVLSSFEAGEAPDFRRASLFFETLRKHTMEGFLGEPAYGGNRGLGGLASSSASPATSTGMTTPTSTARWTSSRWRSTSPTAPRRNGAPGSRRAAGADRHSGTSEQSSPLLNPPPVGVEAISSSSSVSSPANPPPVGED